MNKSPSIAKTLAYTSTGWLCAALLLSWPLAGGALETVDPHAHHRQQMQMSAVEKPEMTQVRLVPEALIDQNGEQVNSLQALAGERIVVMNFVYTTCTTVCPVTSAVFEQLQAKLAERLGSEVLLVSVSVDPVRDTPQRLKEYAGRYHAGQDWLWLTGEKRRLDRVLEGLGAYTPDFKDHPAMVLVGDPSSGRWQRFFGFPSPEAIMANIDQLSMNSRHAMAEHQHEHHAH